MSKITVDIQVKEDNGKHLITLDRLKSIPVNQAIEILQIKYATKGVFQRICKGLDIMADELEDLIYKKNARDKRPKE